MADDEGNPALHEAALQGNVEKVRKLLSSVFNGEYLADINALNGQGRTALMLAAAQRNATVATASG